MQNLINQFVIKVLYIQSHIPLKNVYACLMPVWITSISYTLSREYRVVKNRYSRLLSTGQDRLCANSRVQKQSTNMTLQYQYPMVADQPWWPQNAVSEKTVLSDNGDINDR